MPRYGHRSDPQIQVADRLMTTSVGSTIVGSATSSKRTSRGPCNTVPCICHSPLNASCASTTAHLLPSLTLPCSVLLVADVLEPVHRLALELLLHGDVRHRRGRRRAVPVLFAGGK